jgi:Ca-activated chloride channel family protein
MEFATPFFFWLFGFLLGGGGIFLLLRKKQRKTYAIYVPFYEELLSAKKKVRRPSLFRFLSWGKWLFFMLALLLLIIALARPQAISEEKKISKNGVDILIALDVSESMLAEDLEPNRIQAAKKYIDGFVSQLQNDRVGLEVFAGKPFTQSPMSFDYNVIRYYLSQISTETIDQQRGGLGGTAIGDAIIAAINRFQNTPDRTKVLVLLTDGEANIGVDPILAAEHARSNGIKIYTIGIGNKEGAPLPIGERNGQKIYAQNPDGSLYLSKFNEENLKNIARVSGGKYFYAENNAALKNSFESIDQLEKTEYETETSVTKEDRFFPFLFWGFVFAFFATLFLFGETIMPAFFFRKNS